ncbi:hypothetical protein ASG36_01245 [Geodermatophilus sp. Leaf369]|uniref:hypothetical protein n=1 Tax=Geodermatophilus sp. Leaf369 TaxID=1736354 RepID=UPI0006FAC6B4|nr:hypothetical protein [Geodermatophilus sp. Leaf369]KQS59709.1 hypothetical protein ASG36_01245 [Geodermatophilus sp. Leaf369]
MSRRGTGPEEPTLTVCRGCCCGRTEKHPEVDHRAQLSALQATGVRVRVVDCLDACERSNVVVVSPSPAGRDAGARPVWLGGVLDVETTTEVAEWVRAGGPGVADPPGFLDLQVFSPSRRTRAEAEL